MKKIVKLERDFNFFTVAMIHLHGRSHYSMLRAIWTPKDIIKQAEQNNQTAIAITDPNAAYGLLEFYENAKNIKAIMGVDIDISHDKKNFMNIVLLAKNYQWYKNIIKLISLAHTENIEKEPFITIDNLKENSESIIALSGWKGEIEKLILAWESKDLILDKISEYEQIFAWEFYLEFLTHEHAHSPNRKKIETIFYEFTQEHWKKAVVSSDYRYTNQDWKQAYDVLLCIKNNRKYHSPQRPHLTQNSHIMTEEEVSEILLKNSYDHDFIQNLIKTTHDIADQIDCELPYWEILFPNYVMPEKYENLFKKLK